MKQKFSKPKNAFDMIHKLEIILATISE